jgi:hypothetical protein
MQQNPYPQLPGPAPDLPAGPVVVPMLPTRVRQPGRQAPLPDAVAVRQLAVPDTAPPFDDEVVPLARLADEQPGSQGDRSQHDHSQDGHVQGDRSQDAHGHDDHGQDDDGKDDRRHDDHGRDDDQPPPPGQAGAWPSQFAQVLAETLAGTRPAQQLTPWTTEQARRKIRQLGPLLATDQRPRVRRVMTSAPASDVLELAAVVGFGPRIALLAIRLEREQPRSYRRGGSRWCCTAIESA